MRCTRLNSGVLVATDVVPAARSVAAGVWVGVGSRDEPAAMSGVSHLLEHLVFKGTQRRTAQEISRTVDRHGGDLNAYTTKEFTAFHGRMPVGQQGLLIDVLGDLVTRPLLDPADVDSERRVVLDELAMDDDSPEDVAHRVLAAEVFGDHGLGRETAGERSTVVGMDPAAVRGFYEAWYSGGVTVVAVAGPVDHDVVVAQVEQAFMDFPAGGTAPVRRPPGALDQTGTQVCVDDSEQVHLAWGWRGVPRTDPDREALDVVNHVVGGGLSSRLFDEIRERRGLAYSVYSGATSYADAGLFTVYVGTLPEHVDEVVTLVDAQLEALCRDGITDDELEVAVGYLTGSYELGLDDTGARMGRLGDSLTTLGEVVPVEEQLRRWRAVDRRSVTRVIERIVSAPHRLVMVGPVHGSMSVGA